MTTTHAVRNRVGELERFQPEPLPPMNALTDYGVWRRIAEGPAWAASPPPAAMRVPYFAVNLVAVVLIVALANVAVALARVDWAVLLVEALR